MNPDGLPVALIIGASRGIGRQVAIDLARNGHYVVVAAKTTSDPSKIPAGLWPPDPNSPQSTINTVAQEITEEGGHALALKVDVRDIDNVKDLVDEVVNRLGSIDVLIYNSGAIWWSSVEGTPVKRFQLMQRINPEGLYAAVHACLPHFKKQDWKGRIIVVSPPIYSRFFRGKTAYAMGKVGMSVLTKGLAMDFVRQGHTEMAITSIWPAAAIESAATQTNLEIKKDLRKPTIYSDAILAMLESPPETVNGLLDTDEDFLRRVKGYTDTDFDKYSVIEGSKPRRIMPAEFPILEVAEQDDEGRRVDSNVVREEKEKEKGKKKEEWIVSEEKEEEVDKENVKKQEEKKTERKLEKKSEKKLEKKKDWMVNEPKDQDAEDWIVSEEQDEMKNFAESEDNDELEDKDEEDERRAQEEKEFREWQEFQQWRKNRKNKAKL